MRVTQNTNFEAVRYSVRRTKGRMENLQRQAATLKKLNSPSENPVGAAKVLEIRTDKVNNEQYMLNAKLAETYLSNTDHALNELSEIVVRAKEIAIGQASGASSNDDTRMGVAEEVGQLFQQAVAAANTRIGDRYLFGGYKTNSPPVDPTGNYVGDYGQVMVEIARDVYLSMNVPGIEAFNTRPSASVDHLNVQEQPGRGPASEHGFEFDRASPENVNAFNELQNLRISLLTGDLDGIRDAIDKFDQIHGKLVAMRAKVGSRIKGLESSTTSLERQNITNAQLGSSLEDADMAQVMSDLAKEETVFRSALQSSQKLMQPTLMDFLK